MSQSGLSHLFNLFPRQICLERLDKCLAKCLQVGKRKRYPWRCVLQLCLFALIQRKQLVELLKMHESCAHELFLGDGASIPEIWQTCMPVKTWVRVSDPTRWFPFSHLGCSIHDRNIITSSCNVISIFIICRIMFNRRSSCLGTCLSRLRWFRCVKSCGCGCLWPDSWWRSDCLVANLPSDDLLRLRCDILPLREGHTLGLYKPWRLISSGYRSTRCVSCASDRFGLVFIDEIGSIHTGFRCIGHEVFDIHFLVEPIVRLQSTCLTGANLWHLRCSLCRCLSTPFRRGQLFNQLLLFLIKRVKYARWIITLVLVLACTTVGHSCGDHGMLRHWIVLSLMLVVLANSVIFISEVSTTILIPCGVIWLRTIVKFLMVETCSSC